MFARSLPKFASDYIGQIFVPGYDTLLKERPWFADACGGLECPDCPKWLGQYLCAEGLDRAKILVLLRDPEMHGKVCGMLHHFNNYLDMSMSDAADACWGFRMDSKEYCSKSSAKIIGIVQNGEIVDTITLYRDPEDVIEAINNFLEVELHGESIHFHNNYA